MKWKGSCIRIVGNSAPSNCAGTPGEVGRANALGGVSLPADWALEAVWLSSNGESTPGVEEE